MHIYKHTCMHVHTYINNEALVEFITENILGSGDILVDQ